MVPRLAMASASACLVITFFETQVVGISSLFESDSILPQSSNDHQPSAIHYIHRPYQTIPLVFTCFYHFLPPKLSFWVVGVGVHTTRINHHRILLRISEPLGALSSPQPFPFRGSGIMARVCHMNRCPVGVATQREDLRYLDLTCHGVPWSVMIGGTSC